MTLDAHLRDLIAAEMAPVLAELRALRTAIEQRRESESPWMTRAELAAQLAIHIDTLDRRAAARDGIELRRVGRAVRVRLIPRASEAEVAAAAQKALA